MNDYMDTKLVAARIERLVHEADHDRLAVKLRRDRPAFGLDIKLEIHFRTGRPLLADS